MSLATLPAAVCALYAALPGFGTVGALSVLAVHIQEPLISIWKLRIGVQMASASPPSMMSFWPTVRQRSRRAPTRLPPYDSPLGPIGLFTAGGAPKYT